MKDGVSAKLSRWFTRMKAERDEAAAVLRGPAEHSHADGHTHPHDHFDGVQHVHQHGHGDHEHDH